MASELENKKFIEEAVRPFFQKRLPEVLARIEYLEAKWLRRIEAIEDAEGECDVGLEAWKKQTYGG